MQKHLATVLVALTAGAASATPLTTTSPAGGALPSGVSPIGGIVFDAIGLNGARVVTQLAASSLFEGFASGNPLVIGTQTGFTPAITGTLGGGLSEVAVRLTLDDGDTASGNFDFNDVNLLLNDLSFGNFSAVATEETDPTGQTALQAFTGFPDEVLATGFFFSDDASALASLFSTLTTTEQLVVGLSDVDPGDNFLDFTQGVDSSLIDVGTGPVVTPTTPVPVPAALPLLLGGVAVFGFMARRRA